MKQSVDIRILKKFGINFANGADWKSVMNASFSVIEKLSSFIISKEEQYEAVSQKWMLCKRENKQMKKEQTLLQAQMDKQMILINGYKRRISDNDEQLKESKVNVRELNDKIREFEIRMSQIRNEYEQENTALGVKLKNALHEM